MDLFTWTLLICAVSLCIYYYYRKKYHNFNDWGIPQPREMPVLGIIGTALMRKMHVTEVTKEVYNLNKDAKYVGVHSFMTPLIVVRDMNLIKQVLIKDFEYFSDHKTFFDEAMDPLLSKNLVSLRGEKWREVRNLLSPAFTSSKMKTMFMLMSKCAENFTDTFIQQFGKEKNINMKDALTKYTNDVIASCAFGIEIDSLKNPNNEFYVYGKQILKVEGWRQVIQIVKVFIIIKLPKLSRLLGLRLLSKKIADFFVNVIDKTIKMRDENGTNRPDMLQLMMNARENAFNDKKLQVEDITAQALLFFLAGFETAALHMCLMAHEIAANDEIQEKLQTEMDEICKTTEGKVNYEAMNNTPYFDAVFQETMRKHSQVAFLSRNCTKTYELPPTLPGAKPYVMEPGMEIIIPSVGIHENPTLFENPEKFDPERFMGKKITTNDVTSLGFGIGPRMCIGSRFAILETKVLFYHLLKKCNLQPCEKTCLPLKYSSKEFGPIPQDGFWLKIKER